MIKLNGAKCLECGNEIYSLHRHDFVTCGCGNISVDGGLDYLKRSVRDGFDSSIDLSEIDDDDGMQNLRS